MLIHRLRNKLLGRPAIIRARTRDNAFTYRMPAGIPGDVNRAFAATIEPNTIMVGNPPTFYGEAVAIDPATGGIRPVGAADDDTDFYGLYVRPFPTNQQTTTQFFGQNTLGSVQTPPAVGMCDVLKRGYMLTTLYGATAAQPGGAVYVRIQNPGAGEVVGGVEAAADGGNTVQAGTRKNTYFRGPADSSGNIELAWNI